MKVSENFVLRSIMDEFVIVPVGEAALQFNGVITTNGTGAFLWNLLQQDVTADALQQALLNEYNVTPEKALEDVHAFLNRLREYHILSN